MKLKIEILAFLLVMFGLEVQAQKEGYPTKEVIDTVKCSINEQESYALYLPSNYSSEEEFPVIFIFEPMARGSFATSLFVDGAEKYGYIIACSNNSRNGSYENSYKSFKYLLGDVSSKFKIDPNRIYVSGFSGGSRTALAIAIDNDKIAGVIGCGAALPPHDQGRPTKENRFSYVGMVGNKDMNYQEMFWLKGYLYELGIANSLLTFDGSHQWPPPNELIKAFEWIEIERLSLELIKSYENEIEEYESSQTKIAQQMLKEKKSFEASLIYQNLITSLSGIAETKNIISKHDRLIKSKGYKSDLKKWTNTRETELSYQKKYENAVKELIIPNLEKKDSLANWWGSEIKQLQKMNKSDDVFKSEMAARLMNKISIMSIKGYQNRFYNKDSYGARALVKLGIQLQPKNANYYYYLARVECLESQKDATLTALEKAMELGFSFPQWVDSQTFACINNEPRFREILDKLN